MVHTGKTSSGFAFAIDDRAIKDARLFDAMYELQEDSSDIGKTIKNMRIIKNVILGDKVEKLHKHIADQNDGYVPSDIEMKEIMEIIEKCNPAKNS